MDRPARLMVGGDVMLGRLVADSIGARGADHPLAPIADIMRSADLTLINLECAITASSGRWPGAPKAFYFGAPPEAVRTLTHAGVDLVSLANNHTLDFDVQGLRDTLRHLAQAGIACAGAGENAAAARAPALVERGGVRFALVAYCDHQEDFAAGPDTPGIAWLDLKDEAGAVREFEAALGRIRAAGGAHWPILSLHWGPNFAFAPAERFTRLARAAVDAGFAMVFGHSAHNFQGVELYHGRPILYSTGDLVDDYAVDPWFRNDRSLLFELEISGTGLQRMRLHPVVIDDYQTRAASGADFEWIVQRLTDQCTGFRTRVQRSQHEVWIEPGSGAT
ncbi:MAG TPA: CapA family protein [Burkholderiales bacterium]|jgi:poly-gamma-glutamate synthesis protein (capsule biosynthesis protein)